jgi:hypothetical protein
MKILTNTLFKYTSIPGNKIYIHNIILNCVRKECFVEDLYSSFCLLRNKNLYLSQNIRSYEKKIVQSRAPSAMPMIST